MPYSQVSEIGSCHKTGIRALQDSAYSYRVWITMIKLLYATLQHLKIAPDIHQGEKLYGRLLPSARRVSEKNSSRKPGEQARSRTPWYQTGVRVYERKLEEELRRSRRSWWRRLFGIE